jgi:hypothetical protein
VDARPDHGLGLDISNPGVPGGDKLYESLAVRERYPARQLVLLAAGHEKTTTRADPTGDTRQFAVFVATFRDDPYVKGTDRVTLAELPVASTSLTDVVLEDPVGVLLELRCTYVGDDDVRYAFAFHFDVVRALRHRAEMVCTLWHIQGAYDTLVKVRDSEWREEIETLTREQQYDPGELHHYMIYLDSSGCYEVIARTWEMTEPQPV